MAELPKRPVISPVDYDAWSRGYMPPSEHILIDQLMFRGARVKFSSDDGPEGTYWLVVRGRNIKREYLRKICETLLDCWEIEECSNEATLTDASKSDGSVERAGTGDPSQQETGTS